MKDAVAVIALVVLLLLALAATTYLIATLVGPLLATLAE